VTNQLSLFAVAEPESERQYDRKTFSAIVAEMVYDEIDPPVILPNIQCDTEPDEAEDSEGPFELEAEDEELAEQVFSSSSRKSTYVLDPEAQAKAHRDREEFAKLARSLSREDLLLPQYNDCGWTQADAESYELGHPWADPFHYPPTVVEIETKRYAFMTSDYAVNGSKRMPKDSVKLRTLIESRIRSVNSQIEREGAKYEQVLATGVASFDDYALMNERPGSVWRGSIALMYNHLRYSKAEMLALQEALDTMTEKENPLGLNSVAA
jgi:hypothetical protein